MMKVGEACAIGVEREQRAPIENAAGLSCAVKPVARQLKIVPLVWPTPPRVIPYRVFPDKTNPALMLASEGNT